MISYSSRALSPQLRSTRSLVTPLNSSLSSHSSGSFKYVKHNHSSSTGSNTGSSRSSKFSLSSLTTPSRVVSSFFNVMTPNKHQAIAASTSTSRIGHSIEKYQQLLANHRRTYSTINNEQQSNNGEQQQQKSGRKKGWFLKTVLLVSGAAALGSYVYFKVKGSPDVKLEYLKRIPFRVTSHLWGKLASTNIPLSMRETVYKSYARMFGVILEEVERPLEEYSCLADFFCRHLKQGARICDDSCHMVSPVDGKIIYSGKVDKNSLEQVKGLTYSLEQFLGKEEMAKIENKNLYHIGIYLSPGDYHGIHSPTEWTIDNRYHFPGYLFPVAKVAVDNIPGLFAMNERVVLAGKWKYGYFSLTPVGASNVGTIVMEFDKELKTNNQLDNIENEEFYSKKYIEPIKQKRGEELAFFKMGSTVIIVFEVPQNHSFEFDHLHPGTAVKLGQPIGYLKNNK